MQNIPVGTASVRPKKSVVAGDWTTIEYTYAADHPIDDTGFVKVVFRRMGDFGQPQFDDPKAPNYCTVSTTGNCRVVPRWDGKGHTRPWSAALFLQITGGYLGRGEKITVVFGDKSGNSPGWRMQTFREQTFEFKTLVDPIATYEFKEIAESPTLRVVAGPPAKALCIAPSEVEAGKPFEYHLRLLDAWGNPANKVKRLRHKGFAETGVRTVSARDAKTGLSATSNPVRVVGGHGALRPFWGDLHGQSEETIGSNSIEDYWAFGRDDALMDILSHQGNDFQVTDEFWERVNETAKEFYEEGKFVTFPGYEWSGNTPLGGDRNVYYEEEGGRIARSCRDLLPGHESRHPDAPTADDLFRRVSGPGPWVYAHVGGRYADMRMHDGQLEVAVEIHSAWGTFEWLLDDALEQGWRVGVVGNSDDHKCRPGASYPGAGKFGSLGGLTCVLAERLDRASVAAAIRNRRCYATTGARILLETELAFPDGRTAGMGEIVKAGGGAPVLRVNVAGTGPVEAVEIRNGLDVVKTLRPYAKADLGRRVKVTWSGAEVRGRARMARWDGSLLVRGNRIEDVQPINFWNPLEQPRQTGASKLEWRSATTGGTCGVVLTLRDAEAGTLEIETVQKKARLALPRLGLSPRKWDCGGLRKRIEAVRLPETPAPSGFRCEVPLKNLRCGDNPIYVRVLQEDGHMAWSSPVYVLKG